MYSFCIRITLPFCITNTDYFIIARRNHLDNNANPMIQINIVSTFYFPIINNKCFVRIFWLYLRNSNKTSLNKVS